jgi:hypothetical protein
MQFKAAIIAAICFIGVCAIEYPIPAGQASGIYTISTELDGTVVHQKISDLVTGLLPLGKPTPNRLMKRYTLGAYSCTYASLNHANVDAVNGALNGYCGSGAAVANGTVVYAYSGAAVAYFCNFQQFTVNYCTASVYGQVLGILDQYCGWYGSGYVADNNDRVSYGWSSSIVCA